MARFSVSIAIVSFLAVVAGVSGIGANWGTQTSHPLPPETVVKMLRDNGIKQVKLFDADYWTLRALGKSEIEVMVGIPNDMLESLAKSPKAAKKWVSENVTTHISNNKVDIRYVAVGNEPFLETYNGSFLGTTFPAMQNIQSALNKAGLGNRVKITVPLNADVYESSTSLPSSGNFRADIRNLMITIVKFLSDNSAPFTVNIYPFISLYSDPNFPVEYAFFDGNSSPIEDNGATYYNMFDANYDTLVYSLERNGFGNLPILIGEIGWPTDGDRNANIQYAKRFNQGFISHILEGKGTPKRPGPINAYLFSLIDEDAKSIDPGNFERHWGIFTYDGIPKYPLNLGTTRSGTLVPAKNVHHLDAKWCVLKPSASPVDPEVAPSVSYACGRTDCTSLGDGGSCANLDAREKISYAFNSYYQRNNQADEACKFPKLSMITNKDPTTGGCRFGVMIQPYYGAAGKIHGCQKSPTLVAGVILLLLAIL